MGTISEKLTYLNTTKQNIKQAINNLGGDITSSTTFRNYATELNDIYDNLPKVSDTGTNVSLSPTLKGRLGIVPKGNTYQESTTGKNLLPITATTQTVSGVTFTINEDGTIIANGTATTNVNFNVGTIDNLVLGNTYHLCGCPSGGSSATYRLFMSDITTGSTSDFGSGSNYAIQNTSVAVRIIIQNGVTVNNLLYKPMVSTDTTLTYNDYEPYTNGASPNPDYPQEIQSATGTQKVVVGGKNLYDINNFELSTWDTGGGNYSSKVDDTIKSTSDFTIYRSKCVEIPNLKSNTNYTLSGSLKSTNTTGGKIIIYGYNGSSISSIKANDGTLSVGSFSLSFNTGNYTNIGISFNGVGGSGTKETIFENIMISTTGGEYQPYQEPQEVDIELGNIEPNKIGTYEDYIDGTPDNWVYYNNIGKVVLNGSETWIIKNNTDNNLHFSSNALDTLTSGTNQGFCDNFKNVSGLWSNDTQGFEFITSNYHLRIRISSTLLSEASVNGFKSWLSTHNTELLYVLAETQQTPITEEPLVSQLNELYYLQSYNDTTNIDVTGNLPMRITASAIKGA